MSIDFASSSYLSCHRCGASFAATAQAQHVCDPEHALDHRMAELREGIDGLEAAFGAYLDSAHGAFAQWLAERRRAQSL
jgi:hypothetical protein